MIVVGKSSRKLKMLNNGWNNSTILIAIPIFNELKYLDDVLNAVRRYSDNILVVDDGSTDGSSEVLKKYAYLKTISHRRNIGYGQSLIDAFRFAGDYGFEWIITVDCDHQHEPSYIPHFYREIEKNDADIISGSRYLLKINAWIIPPPPERVAVNKIVTKILNENLAIALTDAFCGFKAYRIKAISRLKLSVKGYGLPLQLWIQASRADMKIREIPVPLIYHDPKRNFCGPLEDPQRRLNYYLQIIARELGYNVSRKITETLRS
jgi:glycosyltransferase involved in cell wall biosynthesis